MPEVWKTAHPIPVLKKGKDKSNPSSCRPISLLSCVGKLMDRVITRRLTWFLETNNVFSPSQTGYHQHRSTEDQLALLTQDIENSFQEKPKLLAVVFRPVKVFDRVWKKRTAVETVQSMSFRSNVQMDRQVSLPQSGQSET